MISRILHLLRGPLSQDLSQDFARGVLWDLLDERNTAGNPLVACAMFLDMFNDLFGGELYTWLGHDVGAGAFIAGTVGDDSQHVIEEVKLGGRRTHTKEYQ